MPGPIYDINDNCKIAHDSQGFRYSHIKLSIIIKSINKKYNNK